MGSEYVKPHTGVPMYICSYASRSMLQLQYSSIGLNHNCKKELKRIIYTRLPMLKKELCIGFLASVDTQLLHNSLLYSSQKVKSEDTLVTKTYKIKGMTCNSCVKAVKRGLLANEYISEAKVSLEKNEATITFDENKIGDNEIKNIVAQCGYTVSDSIGRKILEWSIFVALFLIIYRFLLNNSDFNILTKEVSYPLVFLTGVLTSLHCISMCGGICIAQGVASKNGSLWYNLGRITSYTVIGAIVGAIGSVLTVSLKVQSAITIFAGVFMILMSLQLLGLTNIWTYISKIFPKINIGKVKNSSPFVVGLLNGFMPCGPLQAMQLYALATGSALEGGLVMLLFALGTSPLMYSLGFITRKLSKRNLNKAYKFSGVLVLVLGFIMINRGLLLDGKNIIPQDTQTYAVEESIDAEIVEEIEAMESATQIIEGVQYVTVEALYRGYTPDTVYVVKDMPVVSNIKGVELSGCNNAIVVPDLDIQMRLQEGDNIFEFTPTETGTINYSCWMAMIHARIVVVDSEEELASIT